MGEETIKKAADRPGFKTTEFWLTVAFHISAVALTVFGALDAGWTVSAMAIAQAVYTWSRARVKKDAAS